MTKPSRHLTLVPPLPQGDFEDAGLVAAREACERLAAVTLLARFNNSPAVKQARADARSALVPYRLTRTDTEQIELRSATAVVRYFLEE